MRYNTRSCAWLDCSSRCPSLGCRRRAKTHTRGGKNLISDTRWTLFVLLDTCVFAIFPCQGHLLSQKPVTLVSRQVLSPCLVSFSETQREHHITFEAAACGRLPGHVGGIVIICFLIQQGSGEPSKCTFRANVAIAAPNPSVPP